MEGKDSFILHSHNYWCWYPGDARSQGISSHGIDLILVLTYRDLDNFIRLFSVVRYLKIFVWNIIEIRVCYWWEIKFGVMSLGAFWNENFHNIWQVVCSLWLVFIFRIVIDASWMDIICLRRHVASTLTAGLACWCPARVLPLTYGPEYGTVPL